MFPVLFPVVPMLFPVNPFIFRVFPVFRMFRFRYSSMGSCGTPPENRNTRNNRNSALPHGVAVVVTREQIGSGSGSPFSKGTPPLHPLKSVCKSSGLTHKRNSCVCPFQLGTTDRGKHVPAAFQYTTSIDGCRGNATDNPGDASPGLRNHLDTSTDPLLELSHVGDDADRATALAQVRQNLESLVQRFRVERAEAFIDKQ